MSQQKPGVLRQIAESLDLKYCLAKSNLPADLFSQLKNIAADSDPP
jgi:hypothetical protein